MTVWKTTSKFTALAAVLLLSACAETQLASHLIKQIDWPGQEESKGLYKVGKPYNVGGVWYYPKENFNLVETGIASWYGPGFHAEHTANGEKYDQNELTAAHRTLQLPSIVRVTNLENGKSVVVRVNDRGPFLHGRIMDVSKKAAELLGFIGKGTARVRLEVLERESRIISEAAKRGEDTTRMSVNELQNVRVASAAPVNTSPVTADDSMPESLRAPTITVEELAAPGTFVPPAPAAPERNLAPGHMNKGKFLPDPVVSRAPVRETGIFVQAGSFSVKENADRLKTQFASIAPVVIDPVSVGGRMFYRVKLGPIDSVEKADRVLEKVIRVSAGAKVVKSK